jgi:inward rectifier potassium channel
MMRIYDLNLLRSTSPMLLLTWLVMHPIDKNSPLFGINELELQESNLTIVATVTGLDETLSQTIHAKTSYQNTDILWNKRFKDLFKINKEKNIQFIDLSELNAFEDQ